MRRFHVFFQQNPVTPVTSAEPGATQTPSGKSQDAGVTWDRDWSVEARCGPDFHRKIRMGADG